MPEHFAFISDAMLGSLSKWLRLLGFDTLYFRKIDDNELIRIAKQDNRILLTRDTRLAMSKKAGRLILIHSNDTFEQLKEVLTSVLSDAISNSPAQKASLTTKCRLSLSDFHQMQFDLPRCAMCNGKLNKTDKITVANKVPEHVYLNIDTFFKCNNCGRIYWEGSHKKFIDKKTDEILRDVLTRSFL